MQYYSFLLLLFSFTFFTSYAFELSPTQVTHLSTENGIWKPSNTVVIKEGVACSRAFQKTCENCLQELTAICTFDAGKSFSIQQTKFPFCGNKGIVVDEILLCPLKTKRVNNSIINVTVVSYKGETSLVEEEEEINNKMLSFVYWGEEEIVNIEFKGNTIFFPNENFYLMNTIVTLGNSSSKHVLFNSYDGYVWKAWSKIPLEVTDTTTLIRNGKRRITISAYNNNKHYIISSNNKGKKWGTSRLLNISLPPVAFIGENGIVIESGLSNQSKSFELIGYVEGKSKKKVINLIDLYKEKTDLNYLPQELKEECNEENSCFTSSYVTLMSFQPDYVTALFDFISTETKQKTIAGITLKIDDTEEKNEILKEIKKTEEIAKQREEARKKAQKEYEERRRKEIQEKRRKEQERKERFKAADLVNIEVAKARLIEDGEMIIVRDVLEDMIDIEKQTFFW